jgi:hypothetical protein
LFKALFYVLKITSQEKCLDVVRVETIRFRRQRVKCKES